MIPFKLSVQYVDELGWKGGCFNSRFIFPKICIKNKYKNDVGLHKHELTHYKQWKRLFIFHDILYNISKKYRLWAEIQAYIEQYKAYIKENPHYDYSWMIDSIFKKYNLGYKKDYIKERFENKIKEISIVEK